jgi:hypothetical protein
MMVAMHRFIVPAVLVGLSACAPSFHVPAEVAGDVPVTLSNHAEIALCEFDMGLLHHQGGKNWIGLIKPQPGSRLQFRVKPGTYWLVVNGCQDEFKAGGTIQVNGPTDIALMPKNAAPRPMPPVAGYARADVPVMMTVAYFRRIAPPVYSGGAAGGEPAASSDEPAGESGGESSGEPAPAEQPAESAPAESPRCNSSGGTCGWDDGIPCCAGSTCTARDDRGHGTCR